MHIHCQYSYFAARIVILKTVEEVAETRTLLCHLYKAIFLNKSRVYNSTNKNLYVPSSTSWRGHKNERKTPNASSRKLIKELQALRPGHQNSLLLSTDFHKHLFKTFS